MRAFIVKIEKEIWSSEVHDRSFTSDAVDSSYCIMSLYQQSEKYFELENLKETKDRPNMLRSSD